jgi:undecaprenyl-diphosphatase
VDILSEIQSADRIVFLFLNGKHHPFFDVLMFWISHKLTWIPFYFLLLYWIKIQNSWSQLIIILLFISLTVALTDQVSVNLFKNVFKRYRPCHNHELINLVHLVKNCGGKYGFVSSHAANTFGIASFLFLTLKGSSKTIGFILFAWASLVSYSRIYLGVHYPLDILGGDILGIGIAAFMARTRHYFLDTFSKTKKE